ncbi:hypothetical protein M8J76_017025, partial [Diaphorina citri]
LSNVQILDLSYNSIANLNSKFILNLHNLNELYIYENFLSYISNDMFLHVNQLQLLDFRHNQFQHIPISALKLIETQIRSLKTEENPINCDCDQQELWSWLKDHKKIIPEEDILRCNLPLNLKGQSFLDLEPQKFCSSFGEIKMSVRDVQPFSMLVSWVSNLNQSTIRGYRIAYQAIDIDGQVNGKVLEPSASSVKLIRLSPETKYRICILALPIVETTNLTYTANFCTQVSTLDGTKQVDENNIFKGSILTRRLGLIVGSVLGCIVFIILVSILGFLKLKKQKQEAKRNSENIQTINTTDYLNYQQFHIDHNSVS